jgi:hydrogenase/urease accessory protein HupE
MPFSASLLCRYLLVVLSFFTAVSAFAHEPFEITTAARIRATELEMQVTMTRATAHMIALDGQREGENFAPERFPELQPQLLAAASRLYRISEHAQELALTHAEVLLTVENDIEYRLTFPRPPPGPLALHFLPLGKLPEGYGNALNLTQDNPPAVLSFTLLTAAEPGVAVTIAAPTVAASASERPASTSNEPPPSTASPPLFKKFLKLGIEHILIGYDHLLFLGGLLVVARRARSMIAVVTCFTLAHSVTLALAALDIVVIPGNIVEPLIAASIVFVGIENLLTRGEPRHRWALSFAFGLIHGFGFAGVLRELGFGDGGPIAVPLLAFNLGVELGQLLVAAIALPLLLKLHRSNEALGHKIARALSAIVVLLGGWWLLERTVLA